MRVPALLLVLLLAACSGPSQDDGEGKPVPRSPQPTPVATATASPTPSPTPSFVVRVVPAKPGTFQLESFQSPSHNVRCSIALGGDGPGSIRCDVYQHSWKVPPPPQPCEDGDWGSVATVDDQGGEGKMGACVSDPAGGPEVLAYGHGLRLGELECRSATTGMTCFAWTTNHGFTVSKASYRLF